MKKYLAIYQLGGQESAVEASSQTAITKLVDDAAKAAGYKALKNQETAKSLIDLSSAGVGELEVEFQPVDTNVRYELKYTKNEAVVETSYYDNRKALVSAAHHILDELGYEASSEEDVLGNWHVDDSEKHLEVDLQGHLVVMGSDENVISTYGCADLAAFLKQPTAYLNYAKEQKAHCSPTALANARRKALTNLGIGAGIAIVGAVLSAVSYGLAKPGETYTVYTGIIAIGVIDAIYGLYCLANPKSLLKKK